MLNHINRYNKDGMKKKNIVQWSLINGLAVVAYVSLIAWLFSTGERVFGKMSTFWGPFALLLLLVLSAAIVGYLVFGRPIILYLENQKKSALRLLAYTIGWLFLTTIIVLIVQAF